ncbi:ethanolamine ammonia-lyase subunit EutB [Niveibacterium umoris]|uniref:ethanolamine ammonia-lyase subunit EutB n=1 Tax=Niveibacterium umoris TaxID=1193620 RepID=UPI001A90C699
MGLAGRLWTRLQPKHPVDDTTAIAASVLDGPCCSLPRSQMSPGTALRWQNGIRIAPSRRRPHYLSAKEPRCRMR